eukprot:GFYU01025509.1.p1 GENE.GFYU01025509.1~~GFYU01025509.1.p1  ORF type:complete len:157 (-),score=36.35 GFYU01025509.1:41-511(-)
MSVTYQPMTEEDKQFMTVAVEQAEKSWSEGGIPIGSCIVLDGKVVGKGHNQRVQKGSPILHGEMSAFEDAGRLTAKDYKRCTIYTTLSPCHMCSGAILLYEIPRVVIGENKSFQGAEELLASKGVALVMADDSRCVDLMNKMIAEKPQLWNEDIGV